MLKFRALWTVQQTLSKKELWNFSLEWVLKKKLMKKLRIYQVADGKSDASSGSRLMLYVGVICFLSIYVLVAACITWILRMNQLCYGVHWLLGAGKRKLFIRFMVYMSLIFKPAILASIATQNFIWKNTLTS